MLEADPCKRGVLQALNQTRLLNLHTPDILDSDALDNRESIWVESVIRVATNVACNLYPLSRIFHEHVSYCYISYEPSPTNVCLHMDAKSHVEKVYVLCQHILYHPGGFTSNCSSSKWGRSYYLSDCDVGTTTAISNADPIICRIVMSELQRTAISNADLVICRIVMSELQWP